MPKQAHDEKKIAVYGDSRVKTYGGLLKVHKRSGLIFRWVLHYHRAWGRKSNQNRS